MVSQPVSPGLSKSLKVSQSLSKSLKVSSSSIFSKRSESLIANDLELDKRPKDRTPTVSTDNHC